MVPTLLLAVVLGMQIAVVIFAACNAVAIGRLEEEVDEEKRKRRQL